MLPYTFLSNHRMHRTEWKHLAPFKFTHSPVMQTFNGPSHLQIAASKAESQGNVTYSWLKTPVGGQTE